MGTTRRLTTILALAAVVAVAGPTALAAPGGGSTTSGCTPSAPFASIANTWAWASPGAWGMPGQQLRYAIGVTNKDTGCGSSTFTVTLSAPSGFAVSMPSGTITLGSGSSGYLWAYVTSPATAADGNYALSATVARAGVSSPAASSWYKVYSSDTAAPSLYWMNPADGSGVSGRTTYVSFSSSDDHAVKELVVYLDNAIVATTVCDGVTYDCQASYKWSTRRVHGQHTATFQSTDWMGNVASQTATFTVN